MKAIIVEDELASQQYLSGILKKHFPDLTIISVVDNVEDAVADIMDMEPDLIFLDVEIKMGSGFDVIMQTQGSTYGIIFTTAFNTFAIDAFRHHAIDYLLKPLNEEHVVEAVERFAERQKLQQGDKINSLITYINQLSIQKPKVGIPVKESIEFIVPQDIIYGVANGNYTTLWFRNNTKLIACQRIKEIEKILPPQLFFRIHHSYLVNLQYVDRYQKGRGGYVVLNSGMTLPVSSKKKEEFMMWLKNIL